MSRTQITVQKIGRDFELEDMTLTAADAANNMYFENDGKTLLFIKNGHTGSLDVVVACAGCSHNLSEDLTVSTTNAKESFAGPFEKDVWNQSGGTVNLDIATDTNLELAAISFAL